MSIRVVFQDSYGSFSNVFTPFNEDPGTMSARIQDWMYMIGDELIEENALSAAKKFSVFLENIGYPTERNSDMPATNQLLVDLASATVSPSYAPSGETEIPHLRERLEELKRLSEQGEGEQVTEEPLLQESIKQPLSQISEQGQIPLPEPEPILSREEILKRLEVPDELKV